MARSHPLQLRYPPPSGSKNSPVGKAFLLNPRGPGFGSWLLPFLCRFFKAKKGRMMVGKPLIAASWLQPRGKGGWQPRRIGPPGPRAKAGTLTAPPGGDIAIPPPSPSSPRSFFSVEKRFNGVHGGGGGGRDRGYGSRGLWRGWEATCAEEGTNGTPRNTMATTA